jgi:hypothetical protein
VASKIISFIGHYFQTSTHDSTDVPKMTPGKDPTRGREAEMICRPQLGNVQSSYLSNLICYYIIACNNTI